MGFTDSLKSGVKNLLKRRPGGDTGDTGDTGGGSGLPPRTGNPNYGPMPESMAQAKRQRDKANADPSSNYYSGLTPMEKQRRQDDENQYNTELPDTSQTPANPQQQVPKVPTGAQTINNPAVQQELNATIAQRRRQNDGGA